MEVLQKYRVWGKYGEKKRNQLHFRKKGPFNLSPGFLASLQVHCKYIFHTEDVKVLACPTPW